jgi:isopenicillin N synthase-like dioxygenase
LLQNILQTPSPFLHRAINQRYFTEMSRVAFRLLEVIAIGLGLEPTALHSLFKPSHTSFLRLNYYPVLPGAAADSLGISPHKDAGFLTVLVQDDVAGLQVCGCGVNFAAGGVNFLLCSGGASTCSTG